MGIYLGPAASSLEALQRRSRFGQAGGMRKGTLASFVLLLHVRSGLPSRFWKAICNHRTGALGHAPTGRPSLDSLAAGSV